MRAAPFLFAGLGLRVEAVEIDEDGVTVVAAARRARVSCPLCGRRSGRVHARYVRTLADLPWGGARVAARVLVRKLVCRNGQRGTCPRRIFCERLAPFAGAHARR